MQRTRMTVAVLVGVAVATVSGCVTVSPNGPGIPASPASGGPAHDVVPQIGPPPAREALDAVPDASPSAPAPERRAAEPVPRPRAPRPGGAPPAAGPTPPVEVRLPAVTVSALPRGTASGQGVCALGRGIAGWPAGSPQSRLCDQTYGH